MRDVAEGATEQPSIPDYLGPAIDWIKARGGVGPTADMVIDQMPAELRGADDWPFFDKARALITEMGGPPGVQGILAAALYHKKRQRWDQYKEQFTTEERCER